MTLPHTPYLTCQPDMSQARKSEITYSASLAPDQRQVPTQSSSVHTTMSKTVFIRPDDVHGPSATDNEPESWFEISINTTLNKKEFLALDDETLATVARAMNLNDQWTCNRDDDTPRSRGKQRPENVDVFEEYMASFVEALRKELPQDSQVAVVEEEEFERLSRHGVALREITDEEMLPYRERSKTQLYRQRLQGAVRESHG